jgi:hypothetical protein
MKQDKQDIEIFGRVIEKMPRKKVCRGDGWSSPASLDFIQD